MVSNNVVFHVTGNLQHHLHEREKICQGVPKCLLDAPPDTRLVLVNDTGNFIGKSPLSEELFICRQPASISRIVGKQWDCAKADENSCSTFKNEQPAPVCVSCKTIHAANDTGGNQSAEAG